VKNICPMIKYILVAKNFNRTRPQIYFLWWPNLFVQQQSWKHVLRHVKMLYFEKYLPRNLRQVSIVYFLAYFGNLFLHRPKRVEKNMTPLLWKCICFLLIRSQIKIQHFKFNIKNLLQINHFERFIDSAVCQASLSNVSLLNTFSDGPSRHTNSS
jgi:hypothetical protein